MAQSCLCCGMLSRKRYLLFSKRHARLVKMWEFVLQTAQRQTSQSLVDSHSSAEGRHGVCQSCFPILESLKKNINLRAGRFCRVCPVCPAFRQSLIYHHASETTVIPYSKFGIILRLQRASSLNLVLNLAVNCNMQRAFLVPNLLYGDSIWINNSHYLLL